ncbi:THxN family PEP-CTERM protein [Parahaliea sp. F7430]|uniref:THxN family PEP-CTERM protein n=1 Tax=Sediminihaliea albiluteola TaxID=2758564 RepID=A0A7W2YIP4_9GAMM|nr:THxN family PEP-CTERM protein [Sediminihaliea albiluteola]MBA6412731.1 THxN family PEP-CTERM protein [Sediminihaliea albiluteola]
MKLTFAKAVAVGSALALSAQANAALVTDWDWALLSMWENALLVNGNPVPTQEGPMVVNPANFGGVEGYSKIAWGNEANQSALSITNGAMGSIEAADGDTVAVEGANTTTFDGMRTQFALTDQGGGLYADIVGGSTYTHDNFPITGSTLDTVTLTQWFGLAQANAANDFTSLTVNPPVNPSLINIDFFETPNQGGCFDASVSECDDVFLVLNPEQLSFSFVQAGYKYTFEVLLDGNGLMPLPASACAQVGVGPGCIGLQTQENQSNEFHFDMKLSAREVAEPSILALMGLGLLGVGFTRRRRGQSKA